MRLRAFRLISFVSIALFALVLGVKSTQLTGITRLYPTVLIIAVLLGVLAAAGREVLSQGTGHHLPDEIARLFGLSAPSTARLLAFAVLWLAYPTLLVTLGFIEATATTLSFSLWCLRIPRIGMAIVGSILFSVCLAVLFSTVFYIPTPSGVIDDWMARVLYMVTK